MRIGGAEKQLINLINNLDYKKYDVTLLIYAYNGRIDFDINPNIKIIKNHKPQNIKFKPYKIIYCCYYLYKYFNNNNYDILHTKLFMNSLLLRISVPRSYYNRIIASIRTPSYKWWQYVIEYILINRSILTTNSKHVYNKFRGNYFFKGKVFYVPNGFNILENSISKVDESEIVLSTVGRFDNEKNQLLLVKAFRRLNDNRLKIILFGNNGPELDSIINYINKYSLNDSVSIIKNKTDINEIYDQIDIFVLPSKYEGFPNTLYEAMIKCKICLISNSANIDEHIIHCSTGFVFDEKNIYNLMKRIKYVVDNPNDIDIISIKNRAYNNVKNNYSISAVVAKYSQLYSNIIKN